MPKPAEGTQIEFEPVREAIRLIQDSNALFEPDRLEIVEVRLRNAWSLTAHFNNQMTVVFGAGDVERGLSDLRWIVSHAHSAKKELATVNLIPSKNIPVTFFDPPELKAKPITTDGELGDAGASVEGDRQARAEAPAEVRRIQELHSILNSG